LIAESIQGAAIHISGPLYTFDADVLTTVGNGEGGGRLGERQRCIANALAISRPCREGKTGLDIDHDHGAGQKV
jgi:hypothetical protein